MQQHRPGHRADPAGVRGDVAGDPPHVGRDVAEVAGWLAPMPGGVGPMTRAMLLTNVVEAAERAVGLAPAPVLEEVSA